MNIILITGASSGMGCQFALQLDRGMPSIDEFWLVARRRDRLEQLQAKLSHRAYVLPLDLSDTADLNRLSEQLFAKRPVIRMLINCAGFGMIGDFDQIPVAEQAGQIDVNCRAMMWVTYACLPYLREKSRILQLVSAAAFLPQPGFAVYAATKAFALSFSRALGAELAGRRIYVTAVCPGPVRTGFFEVAERYAAMPTYKKRTIVDAQRVVEQALIDSSRHRPLSVCGLPIKAVRLTAKFLPQTPVLYAVRRMKGTKSA